MVYRRHMSNGKQASVLNLCTFFYSGI